MKYMLVPYQRDFEMYCHSRGLDPHGFVTIRHENDVRGRAFSEADEILELERFGEQFEHIGVWHALRERGVDVADIKRVPTLPRQDAANA